MHVAISPGSESTPIVDERKVFVQESWAHPETLPESVIQPSVGRIANVLQEVHGSSVAKPGLETFSVAAVYPT